MFVSSFKALKLSDSNDLKTRVSPSFMYDFSPLSTRMIQRVPPQLIQGVDTQWLPRLSTLFFFLLTNAAAPGGIVCPYRLISASRLNVQSEGSRPRRRRGFCTLFAYRGTGELWRIHYLTALILVIYDRIISYCYKSNLSFGEMWHFMNWRILSYII